MEESLVELEHALIKLELACVPDKRIEKSFEAFCKVMRRYIKVQTIQFKVFKETQELAATLKKISD